MSGWFIPKAAVIAVGGGAVGALAVTGFVLFNPPNGSDFSHAPDCAGEATQELVFQIAKDHGIFEPSLAVQFYNENYTPLEKSAQQIAAETEAQQIRSEMGRQLWFAQQELGDKAIAYQAGLTSIPLDDYRQKVNRAEQAVATAQANIHAVEQVFEQAQRNAREALNHRAYDYVRKQIKYALDAIRMTDKNLAGAITCAANIKAEAERYRSKEAPITYKIEKTSDGRLYATVYGLPND